MILTFRLRRQILLLLLLLPIAAVASTSPTQSVVAQWDFNRTNSPLRASIGEGVITPLGGVVLSVVSGTGSSDPLGVGDTAINLSGFPAKGTAARSAGIEIATGTVGFRNIVLKFDFRSSNTGSRRLQILYSLNGVEFIEGPVFTVAVGAVFTNGLTADLSSISAANNNPQFRIRLVSDFEGANYAAVSGTYGSSGTWRFDFLTVSGFPLSETSGGARPPKVTLQPQSQSGFLGNSLELSVENIGSQPIHFQWLQDGIRLPGATNAVLALPQLTAAMAGNYSVELSNGEGTVTSENAMIRVSADPSPQLRSLAHVRGAAIKLALDSNPLESAEKYQVEGVVTTAINLTSSPDQRVYLQDATAGLGLLWLNSLHPLQLGDRLRVIAPCVLSNGQIQLVPDGSSEGTSVSLIGAGAPLPVPIVLDETFTNSIQLNSLEGQRVILRHVYFDRSQSIFGSDQSVSVTNSAGRLGIGVWIDSRALSILGTQRPAGPSDVTGVLGLFDSSNSESKGYQVIPTQLTDIIESETHPTLRLTLERTLKGEIQLLWNPVKGWIYRVWRISRWGGIPMQINEGTTEGHFSEAAITEEGTFYRVTAE